MGGLRPKARGFQKPWFGGSLCLCRLVGPPRSCKDLHTTKSLVGCNSSSVWQLCESPNTSGAMQVIVATSLWQVIDDAAQLYLPDTSLGGYSFAQICPKLGSNPDVRGRRILDCILGPFALLLRLCQAKNTVFFLIFLHI